MQGGGGAGGCGGGGGEGGEEVGFIHIAKMSGEHMPLCKCIL